MKDGKDLIYEGIATHPDRSFIEFETPDGKDLIYEGIATVLKQLNVRLGRLTEKT